MALAGAKHARKYAATTDECLSLDVRLLQRRGLLNAAHSFALSWVREDKGVGIDRVYVTVTATTLSLDGIVSMSDGTTSRLATRVSLVRTPCNFGGHRAWMLCPAAGCGRRVAVLYLRSTSGCRHCHGLTFMSRRQSPHDRALALAQQLRVRLGGTPKLWDRLPDRPKGMHIWTYTRAGIRILAAELRADRALIAWAAARSTPRPTSKLVDRGNCSGD